MGASKHHARGRAVVDAARQRHAVRTDDAEAELARTLEDAQPSLAAREPDFAAGINDRYQELPAEERLELDHQLVPPHVAQAQRRGEAWSNWAGDQVVRPRKIEQPRALDELVAIVQRATAAGERLKCVGWGHSFSDILDTTGVLVDLTQLKTVVEDAGGLLPREDALWKLAEANEPRVRVVCGARIAELNQALASAGLAFRNLGGHAGQTFLGAVATSTHGSGLGQPPLCDDVLSMTVVTSGGRIIDVEPRDGITAPQKYAQRFGASRTLIQDDATFDAFLVSLGCMGIVHAATVRVSPAYVLRETRASKSWAQVKADLAQGAAGGDASHRYQVIVNPFASRDAPDGCVVIQRVPERSSAPHTTRPFASDFALWFASLGFVESTLAYLVRVGGPKVVHSFVGNAVSSQAFSTPFVSDSYRVYDSGYTSTLPAPDGVSNRIKVSSVELAVPAERAAEAVELLFDAIAANERQGWYQSSPLGLRFVAPSRASLSMMSGRATAIIELPILRGTPGIGDSLRSYEQALCHGQGGAAVAGRPHWGQFHVLTGECGWLRAQYSRADEWLAVYRQFNAAGVFDNHFTDRLGISVGAGP